MRTNHITEEFFRERAVVDLGTGCWEMLTNLDRNGYSRPMFDGRREFAHRASYELHAGWPQRMIARRFGVLQTSISNLKHGVTWKHVPRPWEAG